MAVTADSNVGFKGTVDTAQWAKVAGMGARFAVLSAGALKVTVGGSGDRAVTVAAGEAWGDGVLSTFDTSTNLNGTAVSSDSRWDTLVVRRTWQPALTPTGLAELVILPGSASKAVSASRTTDVGATTSDQPIALLRFAAGSTVVQEVVDLRVWSGHGGGLVADNTDALTYLTDTGTVVNVGGDTYARHLVDGVAQWSRSPRTNLTLTGRTGTDFYVQGGSSVVSLGGEFSWIDLSEPFPNAIHTFVPVSGDSPIGFFQVDWSRTNRLRLVFRAYMNDGTLLTSGSVRVNWIAIGS